MKKILRLIDNQEYTSKDFECKILDEPNAPLLKMAEVELENYGKDGTLTVGELPTKLIPSVKRLCIESSKKVIDNFKNQPVFTPKEIKAIEGDQENIYNIKNAKRTEDKFKITRAISNINFCNNFFSNIGNYNLDKELDIKMALNENTYINSLIGNQKNLSFLEIEALKRENEQYQETMTMLNKRSKTEKFNLCIKNSTYREDDYYSRRGIKKAVFNFCKEYKVSRFDKYYKNALSDFDFSIMDSDSQERVNSLIKFRKYEYRTGNNKIILEESSE